ncbi:cytosine-specific methyltransferase [Planococcus donghaensis MPA1U2]|uniref:Cytosine-specific methyltransferase n=1 Tax=Planococcus donghaensis MPA1U2 TaxID=933115 RepID=E7RCM9_9BACL|nr:DNA cytosine methyltransferase [Planococcus donghaensis]EGA91394.1 cytosine-specific methyltransferase [Planococcus donghaensis MPA1U2]
MEKIYKGISLFTGAGGMDVGFKSAGIHVEWANEIDKDACNTYETNNPETILAKGDLRNYIETLKEHRDIDIVFGGPPCQGFSVAGKMDPQDERSTLIWSFLDVVKAVKPKAFVMENVKALATLEKWGRVREEIYRVSSELGYTCYPFLLNSADFGVPQKRERVFFIGFLNKDIDSNQMMARIMSKKKNKVTVRESISHLPPAGNEENPITCTAKITLAKNPIMRKSPYAGMLFNGMGRPINIDEASNTLPASMGGNKTPIIDENLLYNRKGEDWVVNYHNQLLSKNIKSEYQEAPKNLRRLTIKEAAVIQTFPKQYNFMGSKSSIYKQIGNAVPCLLAEAVAKSVVEVLDETKYEMNEPYQLIMDFS